MARTHKTLRSYLTKDHIGRTLRVKDPTQHQSEQIRHWLVILNNDEIVDFLDLDTGKVLGVADLLYSELM